MTSPPTSTPVKFSIHVTPATSKATKSGTPTERPSKHKIPDRSRSGASTSGGKLHYQDLLPGADQVTITSNTKTPGNATSSKWASDGAKIQASSAIIKFAELLADYINVPDALRRHFSSGKSQVLLQAQKDKSYTLKQARGEPYFRALLFDRIKDVLASNGNTDDLEREQIASVSIRLDYRKIIVHTPSYDGPRDEIRIVGNDITLVYVTVEQDPKWAALGLGFAPGTDDESPAMLMNPLAPLMMLYKYFQPGPAVNEDPALRELRSSPAYIKPIR